MGRSLTASEMGVKLAEEALIDLGFTKTFLAETKLLCSRSTVTSFFSRKPITHENFNKICSALKLQWRDIAEREEGLEESRTYSKNSEQGSFAIVATTEVEKLESQQTDCNKSTINRIPELSIEITGPLTKETLTIILKQLQRMTGDISIQTVNVNAGLLFSTLTLSGTPQALVKIQSIHRREELTKIKNISLSRVLLKNLSGTDLSGTDLSGAELSQCDLSDCDLSECILDESMLIGTDLGGANLRNTKLIKASLDFADLTGANLSGANLSESNVNGAILWNVDFSGAIVESAVFDSNEGISEKMKCNLISRGAIFNDV